MRVQFLLFIGLMTSSAAYAGHFSEGALVDKVEPSGACLYSEVYNASSKTYLILNVVEKLALKRSDLSQDAEAALVSIASEVRELCSAAEAIKFSKVLFQKDQLTFDYGPGSHAVEWVARNDGDYLVYKKLYGAYKNEPLMVLKLRKGKKVFNRVTGRMGAERTNTRYTFYYNSSSGKISSQTALSNKSRYDIKSLRSIYGADEPQTSKPVIKVGVVGTGIDYNHPGIAKHLAYRAEMELGLQQKEILQSQLRFDPYLSEHSYQKLAFDFMTLEKESGFPIWMDQALHTTQPADVVISNQRMPVQKTRDHETRVSSRIIRSGGSVELHFARTSMGSLDNLNVTEVIDNFASKGVRLVNLSFGSKCGDLPLEEKMWDEAFAKYPNIVFVAAAGNSGLDSAQTPYCPAMYSQKYKNVISVTGLDEDGLLATYFGTLLNFGVGVDLAIKSNNLKVLKPYKREKKWENNAFGATSFATAEVSRILTEAVLEGLNWDAQTVKDQLINTSVKRLALEGANKHSSEVDEWAFRAALRKLK